MSLINHDCTPQQNTFILKAALRFGSGSCQDKLKWQLPTQGLSSILHMLKQGLFKLILTFICIYLQLCKTFNRNLLRKTTVSKTFLPPVSWEKKTHQTPTMVCLWGALLQGRCCPFSFDTSWSMTLPAYPHLASAKRGEEDWLFWPPRARTLCDVQCGWISCSRASARCWRGQFTLLRQAFPRTIRDQPQFQSRQKMKCPTVQNCSRNPPWRHLTGMWPVHTALLIIIPFQYEKTSPVWDEQGPLVCFLIPSSTTEERLSLGPLGYILYNLNNTESSNIYQCICHSCLLLTACSFQRNKVFSLRSLVLPAKMSV